MVRSWRLALAVGAVLVQAVAPAHPALAEPPAAIAVTVACAPDSTAFAIEVKGTDFNPFTAVLVTFDAAPGGRPEAFDAATDGFGRFALTLRPQPRPGGSYLVRADDFREREATATATIECTGPPPVQQPPRVFHPTLAFHPAVSRRGFVVALTGSGFPPGGKVHLDWGDLRGRSIVSDLTADGAGNISVSRFLVFEETAFGTDRVLATSADQNVFNPVTARLLVVPGTVEPPGFKVRR